MKATQIRCDDIQTNGQIARVITRKNHVIQTDIKIKQRFDGFVYKFPTPDDTLDKVDPAALQQNVEAWTAVLKVVANEPGAIGAVPAHDEP